MKFFFQTMIFLIIALQVKNMTGQSVSKDFSKKPELDSSIIYGQLNNGLKYYIRPLQNSPAKIDLRFYVKAGSLNQDPDQVNIAHFTEHMAFKSSDNFQKGLFSDLKLLKQLNITLHDFNAHVGPYYSQYIFKAPQENPEALETGLRWFGDIAGRLHLKDKEIDEERGVMIQEVIFRSGDNIEDRITQSRLQAQLVPCSQDLSNFIDHQKNFNPERLRQFYRDWYRPDLMALFVVGKIDNVDSLVEQINKNFSHIKPKPIPKESIDCDSLFFNQSPQFAVVASEADSIKSKKGVKIKFYFRDPQTQENISDLKGLQRLQKMNLLVHIVNRRLKEKTNIYNSFYDAHLRHLFKKSLGPSSLMITIDSKNENEQKAIKQTFQLLRELQKYGVLKEEFEEAVEQELKVLNTKSEENPRYWITEMENHFVYEEYLPENKLKIIKNWVRDYHIEDFQEFIKSVSLEMPQDIGIIGSSSHPALAYTEKEIRSWIKSVEGENLVPYIPVEVPNSLMSSSESKKFPEKSYEDKGIGETGARELILKNGVKVVLKSFIPTPGPNEEKVFLHGFRKKGALNFPSTDYFSAVNAPEFIKNSGLRELDKFQLQKLISNTSLWWHGVKPYIKDNEAGIKIDAGLEDLETMLQLVYVYFSNPRVDSTAYLDWKTQEIFSYQGYRGDIKVNDLGNYIRRILKDNSGVSTGTERFKGLDKTDMNRGLEIYSDLFRSAKDFTFIISGDFETDSVIPLINKYLGNLPNEEDKHEAFETIEPFNPKPKGPVLIQFSHSGALDKNNYMYKPIYAVPDKEQADWREILRAEALGWILSRKIMELRFEKNYSLYTVHAYSKYNEAEKQFELGTFIDCTPEEYPLLRQEFLRMINELKNSLVSEELFEQGIKRMLVEYDPSGRASTHESVQENLYGYYRYNIPWVNMKEITSFIESLERKDLMLAAEKYFKENYLYEFVMKK